MKQTNIKTMIGALVLSSAMGITAFAATTTPTSTLGNVGWSQKGQSIATTQEQRDTFKEQREKHREEMENTLKKWDALSDGQKAEIYKLEEQKIALQSQSIDQYLKLGLISQTQADQMKANLQTRLDNLKKEGKLPMMGYGKGGQGTMGKHGSRGKGNFNANGVSRDEAPSEETTKSSVNL